MPVNCKANDAEVLYALISPGNTKQRSTKIADNDDSDIRQFLTVYCPRIGLPAEPEGSPSSPDRKLFPSTPIR
jgi:hypothetical protein